ncbi:MAG: hypothetical protein AUJ12_07260 [Alphaproteobacteria bacterium CG1_02_46_17]|nr:MAG: hypothetical protein AUJ12_07260 [Alphaproteobacteria bacterium CG1_02_46_17]
MIDTTYIPKATRGDIKRFAFHYWSGDGMWRGVVAFALLGISVGVDIFILYFPAGWWIESVNLTHRPMAVCMLS